MGYGILRQKWVIDMVLEAASFLEYEIARIASIT